MTAAAHDSARRKVFVFSDWHLGGDPDDLLNGRVGTQICRSAEKITGFIDWIASEATEFPGKTEIVINGDMVDFLAPDSIDPAIEWIGDQAEAVRRLDRIIERSRGVGRRGPFEALKDFLDNPLTELTIALGNHDVELSLPIVREHLAKLLGNNPRLRMIYDGEAISRGRLLIEHGNRYDPWNALNFNGLREERSHLSRGFSVSDRRLRFFEPPAGSLMVIYAINTLLAEAPFINLLKPEMKAAIPLLIAIEPNLGGVLNNILRLAPIIPRKCGSRLESAAVPANRDNLTGNQGGPSQIDSLAKLLRPMLGDESEQFLIPPVNPLSMAQGAQDTMSWIKQRAAQIANALRQRLNPVDLLDNVTNAGRFQLLKIAFGQLRDDNAFKVAHETPEFQDAAEAMLNTGKFDVVVFGHTHLQKKVVIAREGTQSGLYINTGTWADIMRLPEELLQGGPGVQSALRQFLTDMTAKNIHGYLFTSLGYAEVELQADQVVSAELHSFTATNSRAVPLTPFA